MRLARFYDPPQKDDGERILVDRLWPRGIRKDDPRIDRWCKDVAPSSELRHWYNHDPARYDEFVARYERELDGLDAAAALDELRSRLGEGPVMLVTATKKLEQSHLPVLARVLRQQ
jgi:uncharacterized protein YeaO (DUF488 family)